MRNSVAELNHYNLVLNSKEVLRDQSVQIELGLTYALVGLSGSGKTQTLRSLAGLNEAAPNPEHRRKIFLSQDDLLFSWLSVFDNLKLISKNEKPIVDWLEKLDLIQYRNYFPYQLSTGIKHRISLIRAFLSEAQVIFLDEAFSKLDYINRKILYEIVFDYCRLNKVSLVLASHDLEDVLFKCDRVMFQSAKTKNITFIEDIAAGEQERMALREKIKTLFEQDFHYLKAHL